MEGYKNRYEKVQRMVKLRVTEYGKKRFKIAFFADRENGITRANILEFEVVMLFLKIQTKTDRIT